jgi:Family of unknown function (DUF5995)
MSRLRDLLSSLPRLIHRRRPVPVEPVPPDQSATVAEVLHRLRAVGAGLPPEDGVAAFNRMYLRVTELVAERLEHGHFRHQTFMTRLDVVFAGLYLAAVEAPAGQAEHCWEPLLERRSQPLLPLQFALAGMNAHINHDLPVAVVRTCRQLGLDPSSPGVREDYQLITAVLAEVHEEVRQSFLDGLVLEVDREVSPLLTLVGAWSVGRARDAAWVNTEVLWQLRGQPLLDREMRATLSRSVGLASRQLLVPVALDLPA